MYFSDHKAQSKSFNFLIKSVPYNVVHLMYEPGCPFSPGTNFMWYTELLILLLVMLFCKYTILVT